MTSSTPAPRPFDLEGLLVQLEQGRKETVLATAEGGVVPFVLATLRHRLGRPLLIVVPDVQRMTRMVEGLLTYEAEQWPGLAPVLPFEPNDQSPYQEVAPLRALSRQRVAAGWRLHNEFGLAAVVLPAEALLWRTLSAEALDAHTVMASVGGELDRVELAEQLVEAGYERVPVVEDPGTFCVRGGVVDVWSPLYDEPIRVELFGDDVEAIRFFDPETQKAGGSLVDLILPPARELLLDAGRMDGIAHRITDLADTVGLGNVELRAIVDELRAGHLLPGLDALLPAIAPSLAPLVELGGPGFDANDRPRGPLVVLEGPDAIDAALDRAWQDVLRHHQEARAAGRLVFPPEQLYVAPTEIRAALQERSKLLVRPVSLAEDRALRTFVLDVVGNAEISRELEESRRGEQGLRPLASRIRASRKAGELVVVTAHSEGGRARIEAILRHYGVDTLQLDEPLSPARIESLREDIALGAVLVLGGTGAGFHLEPFGLLVIDEEEILGAKGRTRRGARKKKATGSNFIRDVQELHEGDYVVHIDHGVGRFARIVRLEAGGVEADYLLLLYKDGQKVYVPMTSLDRVQKYAPGDGERTPMLDKLGGERWQKAKGRAKKAAAEIAGELVKLYAEREAQVGHAFSAPDELYREWEATFPFEETPDQQRAIDETLSDLCAPKPAWRLVCGDVGYGKTEVAVRAAVKAALDGKQVAVLVPTTVLAEQHRMTFEKRCAGLPVTIDSLSRFRTAAEQREVIEKLEKGRVDIIVGTHRLLSEDVKFRDIGLLIIDEEQRFGVKHKEQMQRWRSTVDCIVLSATPIPRTLQMATLGLRDLSLIATPPENRKSVRTIVCRGSDELLKEGLERELARGGQVFYIRNRTGELPEIAEYLHSLVPSVRPVVAHGQMPEEELEEAMLTFMRGDANVLVATTIIESGLDIPNANTMFIDRADTFGLAQLYQLRGRVGRASERAFCYLMVPDRERLTAEGAKRVAVLERFSELGAGIHIASHDLEIRGAGNILGEAQSGHIA
ncbi:MAG: transcription-repair coupling factor, partial [Pseudomonadota bacterium]